MSNQGSYEAKLMDDGSIRSLWKDIRRVTNNIEANGKLREFEQTKAAISSDNQIEIKRNTGNNNFRGKSPRQTKKNSTIKNQDSFTVALVKQHCGIDITSNIVNIPHPPNNENGQRPVSAQRTATSNYMFSV